jgi:hypothetical protein
MTLDEIKSKIYSSELSIENDDCLSTKFCLDELWPWSSKYGGGFLTFDYYFQYSKSKLTYDCHLKNPLPKSIKSSELWVLLSE